MSAVTYRDRQTLQTSPVLVRFSVRQADFTDTVCFVYCCVQRQADFTDTVCFVCCCVQRQADFTDTCLLCLLLCTETGRLHRHLSALSAVVYRDRQTSQTPVCLVCCCVQRQADFTDTCLLCLLLCTETGRLHRHLSALSAVVYRDRQTSQTPVCFVCCCVQRQADFTDTCLPCLLLCTETGRLHRHLSALSAVVYRDRQTSQTPVCLVCCCVQRQADFTDTCLPCLLLCTETGRLHRHLSALSAVVYRDRQTPQTPVCLVCCCVQRQADSTDTCLPCLLLCTETGRLHRHLSALSAVVYRDRQTPQTPVCFVCCCVQRQADSTDTVCFVCCCVQRQADFTDTCLLCLLLCTETGRLHRHLSALSAVVYRDRQTSQTPVCLVCCCVQRQADFTDTCLPCLLLCTETGRLHRHLSALSAVVYRDRQTSQTPVCLVCCCVQRQADFTDTCLLCLLLCTETGRLHRHCLLCLLLCTETGRLHRHCLLCLLLCTETGRLHRHCLLLPAVVYRQANFTDTA